MSQNALKYHQNDMQISRICFCTFGSVISMVLTPCFAFFLKKDNSPLTFQATPLFLIFPFPGYVNVYSGYSYTEVYCLHNAFWGIKYFKGGPENYGTGVQIFRYRPYIARS